MKFFAFLAPLLLTAQITFAMSVHPCSPVIKAMPSMLFCRDTKTNTNYSIQIDTWMSRPSKLCQGKNRLEIHTASVFSGPIGGEQNEVFKIHHNEFTYSLGATNTQPFFKSPKYNLNLNECLSPMYGGFSVGN